MKTDKRQAAPGWSRWAAGAALALAAGGAAAADDAALAEQMRALAARLQQLEARNAELERQVRALQAPAPLASVAAPGSATPPAAPAAAVPPPLLAAAPPQPFEPDDAGEPGIAVEGGLVAVAQRVNGAGRADGAAGSALNWRGDVQASLPVGEVAGAAATAVVQARFGQGEGVATRDLFSGVNATAFETAGGGDAFAIVAQAYLQLDWALGEGGFNDSPGDALQLNVGKMDAFGFFDGNEAAGDEGSQFLNAAFVHNPLLDLGGDVGADDYGFAPGLRVAYTNVGDGTLRWGASLGVFGAGDGASFGGSLGRPLVIAQFEVSPLQINGEARGNYRLYAWTNGRTTGLGEDAAEQRHSGWGLSLDQRVGRDWNLFGRYGQRTRGDGLFDRALTLGFEHGGRGWGRGDDAIGFAHGWLKASDAQRDAEPGVSGDERIAELYYRIHLNEHLTLTPDLQWIQRPAAVGAASDVKAIGVRANLGF